MRQTPLSNQQIGSLKQVVMSMQIICGSLMIGALVLGITMFLMNANRQVTWDLGIFAILGIAMAVFAVIASIVAPMQMANAQLGNLKKYSAKRSEELDSSELLKFAGVFQSTTIIRFALLEGPAFANILFWFLEGSGYNLVAAAFCVLMMVLLFPFPGRQYAAIEKLISKVCTG